MKQRIIILILEDSREDFFLLQEMLSSSEEIEAEILHANRLQEAMETARDHQVDVAVIDLNLPDSSGLDTFLTFHEEHSFLPTIILSGAKDNDIAYEAVSKGAQDYLFKGEPSDTAVIRTIRYAIERQRLMKELKSAQDQVKQLHGLLPICAICKNIRDDQGYWNRIESYISEHSEAQFTHSLCPDCAKKHYAEFLKNDEDE